MATAPSSPMGPTASNHATTTNPNTPRSESDLEQHLLSDAQQAVYTHVHKSQPHPDRHGGHARTSGYDDEDEDGDDDDNNNNNNNSGGEAEVAGHFSPRALKQQQHRLPARNDKTKIQAVASWDSGRIENFLLDIHWTPRPAGSGSAFLKLYNSRRHRVNVGAGVWIFVYPERIRRLSVITQPREAPFGPQTVAITFEMHRPPVLVLPPISPPPTQNETTDSVDTRQLELMELMHGLVRQSSFTVYIRQQRRNLPLAWLERLCTDVTAQRLSTIATRADVSSLYKGKGARLIEGDSLALDTGTRVLEVGALRPDAGTASVLVPNEPPPTYEDAGLPPPSPPPTKGKERAQSSHEATSPAAQDEEDCKPMDRAVAMACIDARLALHKSEVVTLLSTHRAEVQELLATFKDELDSLKTQLATIKDGLAKVPEDIVDELTNFVDERVNERVTEGMDELEDRIMDNVTSLPLQATLTFPDHPLY